MNLLSLLSRGVAYVSGVTALKWSSQEPEPKKMEEEKTVTVDLNIEDAYAFAALGMVLTEDYVEKNPQLVTRIARGTEAILTALNGSE